MIAVPTLKEAIERCTKPTRCHLFKAGGNCGRYEYRASNGRSRNDLIYVGKLVPITEVENCDRRLAEPLPPAFSVNVSRKRNAK